MRRPLAETKNARVEGWGDAGIPQPGVVAQRSERLDPFDSAFFNLGDADCPLTAPFLATSTPALHRKSGRWTLS
jgi:hypothetical protein